jgi:nucleoside-diphosphate-sugar epimerase
MKCVVTGADGFIGRALVQRLLANGIPGLAEGSREFILLDRHFATPIDKPGVRLVSGDISVPEALQRALGNGVDYVFHLVSIAGGAAETDFELGMRANLHATSTLLEVLRAQRRPAKLVFASTIAVYGVPLPELIDESTTPSPTLSYGAQKLIGEILVTDYSRRGFIDGYSLRLPGIVARPRGSGMLSAFLSEIIRRLSSGESFVCPVSADGMTWWMSRSCVVENLLHAATLDAQRVRQRRVWLLPVLHASVGEVVDALARVHGQQVIERVSYRPNPTLEAQFASYPPLRCPTAIGAGFKNDGSLDALVQRALEGPQ